jgi:hypothetical protein
MPQAEFEPAIPATKRPQTYVLDREATGIGSLRDCTFKIPAVSLRMNLLICTPRALAQCHISVCRLISTDLERWLDWFNNRCEDSVRSALTTNGMGIWMEKGGYIFNPHWPQYSETHYIRGSQPFFIDEHYSSLMSARASTVYTYVKEHSPISKLRRCAREHQVENFCFTGYISASGCKSAFYSVMHSICRNTDILLALSLITIMRRYL